MASEANRLAPLNVLNDSLPYGRFSGDHVWPVLGVHRGFGLLVDAEWLDRQNKRCLLYTSDAADDLQPV